MVVRVVTDSAATIPAETAREMGIGVVPMWLTIDGTSEPEGPDTLERAASARDVTTSAPSPADFLVAIDTAARDADGVVVLTVAATMSASHASAQLAAREAGGAVRVVDTSTAAGAQGLAAIAAARAARRGLPLEAVEREARRVADAVHLVATLPDLAHLARSGRVPGIAERARRRLGVAPIFEFVDGKARPRRPALTNGAALERIAGEVTRSAPAEPGAVVRVAALHACAPEAAGRLLALVRHDVEPVGAFTGEFSSVMVAHTGPGLAGLAWYWSRV